MCVCSAAFWQDGRFLNPPRPCASRCSYRRLLPSYLPSGLHWLCRRVKECAECVRSLLSWRYTQVVPFLCGCHGVVHPATWSHVSHMGPGNVAFSRHCCIFYCSFGKSKAECFSQLGSLLLLYTGQGFTWHDRRARHNCVLLSHLGEWFAVAAQASAVPEGAILLLFY